jgi:hypothetical protein
MKYYSISVYFFDLTEIVIDKKIYAESFNEKNET